MSHEQARQVSQAGTRHVSVHKPSILLYFEGLRVGAQRDGVQDADI